MPKQIMRASPRLRAEAAATAGPVSAEMSDWNNYLSSLAEPDGPLGAAHIAAIRTLLRALPNTWNFPPAASPTDGDVFMMVWDRAEHHFELDVLADGSGEWFYWNRETEFNVGGSLSVDSPGRDAIKHFKITTSEV
jgi:hypothetical protein